jgi:hypothetical protein
MINPLGSPDLTPVKHLDFIGGFLRVSSTRVYTDCGLRGCSLCPVIVTAQARRREKKPKKE